MAAVIGASVRVDPARLSFVEASPASREDLLDRGEVDLVIAAYPMTEANARRVDFAGPYFVTGQSLLVRRQTTDIAGPRSLDHPDWRLCIVPGDPAAQRVRDRYATAVQLREFPSHARCVRALREGRVDAVTADAALLAGDAAHSSGRLAVVGEPFSQQRYGVGLRKGDPRVERVNAALRNLVRDGSWHRFARRSFGAPGYRLPDPPALDG